VDTYRRQQQRELLSSAGPLANDTPSLDSSPRRVEVEELPAAGFDSVEMSRQVRAEARRRIEEQVWAAGATPSHNSNNKGRSRVASDASGASYDSDVMESKTEGLSTLGLGDDLEYVSTRKMDKNKNNNTKQSNMLRSGDVAGNREGMDEQLESMDALLLRIREKAARDVRRVLEEQALDRGAGR
jgi:hypothetical protein